MSSLEPRLKVRTFFFHKNRLVSEFMSQKEITSLKKKITLVKVHKVQKINKGVKLHNV